MHAHGSIQVRKITEDATLSKIESLSSYKRDEHRGKFRGVLDSPALIVLVPFIAKLTHVQQTVLKSVKMWQSCKHYTDVSFYVVLDSAQGYLEDLLPSFVTVVKVPGSFQPAHAKYKGRALEWFRRHLKLSENDWVLHLDEETEIDEYLVKACLDFIERGTEDVGMVSFLIARELPAHVCGTKSFLREPYTTQQTTTGKMLS